MQIFISKNGEQHGPYSVSDLDQLLQSERISGGDLYWHEGCADWAPLSGFPGFTPPPSSSMPPPQPQHAKAPQTTSPVPTSDFIRDARRHPLGIAMIAVAALFSILIWSADAQSSSRIALAAIWITAILGGIEAKKLGIGCDTDRTPKGKKKYGPWRWGAFIVLLWIIGFPAYLYRRSKYGAKNLLLPAVVAVAFFMAALCFAAPALPAADAPEVVAVAQRAIEESPAGKLGGALVGPLSITDAAEIRYDSAKQKRTARALLKTKLGSETIYYTVEWQNRSKGLIWVQIQDHQ